jgi:predicted NUDIX family NTP pyrophosphohydrolase
MPKRSAGLLMYRRRAAGAGAELAVLLVHPGGPFWAKKDAGAWSIPKGEYADGEEPLAVARREFEEETGTRPDGECHALGELTQPGGKVVAAWAMEGDFDPARLVSNTFEMEWPPRSGRRARFPEVDRAAWFSLGEAREKILRGQSAFLDRLERLLAGERDAGHEAAAESGKRPSRAPTRKRR